MTPYRPARFRQGLDTPRTFQVVRDLSDGVNTRVNNTEIGDKQAEVLYNVDISVPGKTTRRPGSVQVGSADWGTENTFIHNYTINGATDQLLAVHDDDLRKTENGTSWSDLSSALTNTQSDVGFVNAKMSGIAPDDICMIQTDAGDQYVLQSDGTFTDISGGANPPQNTTVMAWYGNRVWTLKNDLLEFSDAYPADYGAAFTNNDFRVPVGEEMGIIATREFGLVIGGRQAIWGLNPSATPDASSDKPYPVVTNKGVVNKSAMITYADDIFWFAQDGLRSLRRTQQDKLQQQESHPLSYRLKNSFDSIDWTREDEITLESWDNKIFCNVPQTGGTSHVWIYYPATNGFSIITGWSPYRFATYKLSGEEYLYYSADSDGKVYRAWSGYTDEGTTSTNGTAFTLEERGKNTDMGNPLIQKYGGEVEVKVLSTDSSQIVTVYASFDDQDFETLGTMDIQKLTGVDFSAGPVTFPVDFSGGEIIYGKFHIDSYGRWRTIQLKLTHTTTSEDDVDIIERSIISYLQDYLME